MQSHQMDSELTDIDSALNGAVPELLARTAVDIVFQLYDAVKTCNANGDIQKKTVLVVFCRVMETSYSMLLLIQSRLGATLGLQARSIVECTADIHGLTKDPKYLESWFGKEKDQLKKILNLNLDPGWKQLIENRYQNIQKICGEWGWCFDGLPKNGGRDPIIELLGLTGHYKILCIDAHNRPTSIFMHHSHEGGPVCFRPTDSFLLAEYLKTLLICLEHCIAALKQNWLDVEGLAKLHETSGPAIRQAILEANRALTADIKV